MDSICRNQLMRPSLEQYILNRGGAGMKQQFALRLGC